MQTRKKNAQQNKKMDPLSATDATCAQGWIVEGDDEEGLDIEPVIGMTWKLIAETCGAEEVNKLRRSARLNQTRDIEDDVHDEPEEEEQMDEEEIEFKSDQENVVMPGYVEEEVEDDD